MDEELEKVQEEPVTEVTENTGAQTVEENEEGIELTDTSSNEEKKEVKTYTDEDVERIVNQKVNELLPKKLEREKKKLEKRHNDELSKYKETENILTAGLGAKDINEANHRMREFYKEQGIEIPSYQQLKHSEREERILAEAEAKEIIDLGYDEIEAEANRLAKIGIDKMTVKEKALFNTLANELTQEKNRKELDKLGVKSDIINDSQFQEFASRFNPKTPIKDVYEMYTKLNQPAKSKVEKIGSMKSNIKDTVKDFYTEDEIRKLTDKELDDPKVWEAVRKSMTMTNK